MDIQTAPPGLDPSMDYDMIDSVKQGRELPGSRALRCAATTSARR